MFGGDAEQDAGRTGGLPTALFPVAQRGGADTEGGRKLRLAEVELGADGGDGFRSDVINAGGGLFVSAQVGSGFADALEEVF